MIILPFGPESDPAREPAQGSRPVPLQSDLRLLVLGFSPAERELIQGIVALTQRRSVRLMLIRSDAMDTADVVMFDGADERVMAWAAQARLLAGKTVLQVDGRSTLPGAIQLQRPIQWPSLPALLQQALDPNSPLSTRQPLTGL